MPDSAPATPAATPAATPPAPAAPPADDREDKLLEKIEAKVRAMFAEALPTGNSSPDVSASAPPAPAATPTAPAAPPASSSGPGIDERIAAAVKAALSERDREDQLFVLSEEIKKLKELAAGPKRAAWSKIIFGPW